MIRAVIFDCFGVLYTDRALAFTEKYVPNDALSRQEIHDIMVRYDSGFISAEEQTKLIAELCDISVATVQRTLRGPSQRNEKLLSFSQSLRPRCDVAMLSNIGSGGMERFFSKAERATLFDVVVLSGDIGMVKPSQEIFNYTAAQLDVPVAECLMVDDREENCRGAEAAGMRSVIFRSTDQTIRDIASHLEISL